MIHAFEDGGVRDMVLKACMSWPWSKDRAVYVGADGGAIYDETGTPGGHGEGEPYGHGDGGDTMA